MVTVIITTFGGSSKLERAINSVLNQTYKDVEVVVVDDNNQDTRERKVTEALMQKFNENKKVKYIQHSENKNGAAARNTGIKAARGEYIAFLDDDDFYLPDKIEVSVSKLQSNQTLGGVCTGVAFIEDSFIISTMFKKQDSILSINELLLDQMAIGTGSNIFLKKSLIDKIVGFDTEFQRFQDVEFMIRALEAGRIVFLEKVSVVKDRSDVRTPDYQKIRAALIVFERRFAQQINSLGSEKRNLYYVNRHKSLYLFAKLGGNLEDIKEAGSLLKGDKDIGLKTGVGISFPIVVALYWYLKKSLKNGLMRNIYVKKIRQKRRNSDINCRSILGEDTYSIIKNIIGQRNSLLKEHSL